MLGHHILLTSLYTPSPSCFMHTASVFMYAMLVAFHKIQSFALAIIQVCLKTFRIFTGNVKSPAQVFNELAHGAHTRTHIENVIQCNEQNADNSNVLFTLHWAVYQPMMIMCLTSIFEWTGHSIQRIAGAVLFPHEFHFNPAATAPNSHHQITAILFDMKLLHESDE